MVGFDPKQTVALPPYAYGICGASAAFLSRVFTQPVDVCKIRFQLQIEPIRRGEISSKYTGLFQAVNLIIKEEGFGALWKGLFAAQCLSVVYGLVQFGTFEFFNQTLWKLKLTENPKDPLFYFVCGSLSGVTATTASQPLDVVRTRFVSQGRDKVYTSLWQSLVVLRRQEGIRGFYRGLLPAVIQIVPYNGASFAFYAKFQEWFRKLSGSTSIHTSAVESLTCGTLAGAVAKTLVYPLDVLKKRLQVVGFEEGRKGFGRLISVSNLRQLLVQMYTNEGLSGFYKGYSPSLIKAAMATGLNFYCYEEFLKMFIVYYTK